MTHIARFARKFINLDNVQYLTWDQLILTVWLKLSPNEIIVRAIGDNPDKALNDMIDAELIKSILWLTMVKVDV